MAHSKYWTCKQISHFNCNIENVPVINRWNKKAIFFLTWGISKVINLDKFLVFLHLYLMLKSINQSRSTLQSNFLSAEEYSPKYIYNTGFCGSFNCTKNKLYIAYSTIGYPLAVPPISSLRVLMQIINTILHCLKLVSKNFLGKVRSSHTFASLFHRAMREHHESKRTRVRTTVRTRASADYHQWEPQVALVTSILCTGWLWKRPWLQWRSVFSPVTQR